MASKYQALVDNFKTGSRKQLPEAKIRAWLVKHFPDHRQRKDGEELLICNPFTHDTDYKFNINPSKASCHDWRGDSWAGPVNPGTGKRNCSFLKFVKLYRKCSYAEALREVLGTSVDLKSYLRPEHRLTDQKAVPTVVVALPTGTERITDSQHDPQARLLAAWLKSRGYSEADIDKYDLYYLGMEVYWPYFEYDELVLWQSRARFNKWFMFPPSDGHDWSKGDFFYGFDEAEMASFVIITEAIFDQYTLGDQALASGGAALTKRQISKLRLLGPRKGIILSPDNDQAGLDSIIRNYSILKALGCPLYYSIPPKIEYMKDGRKCYTKDFNDLVQYCGMSRTEVRQLHDDNIEKLSIPALVGLRVKSPRVY